MLELSLTSGAPSNKFDLKVPCSKLLFRGTFPITSAATMLADFITLAKLAKLTVTRQTPDKGTKVLAEQLTFAEMAEIAAMNEGFIQLNSNAGGTVGTFQCTIELSNSGAVKLDGKDYITVQCRDFGFTATAIYSLGAPTVQDEHLKYSKLAAQGGEQQRFVCTSHYAIAVPANTTKLRLYYANGVTQEIEKDELAIIAADINETAYLVDGRAFPYQDWRLFPLPICEKGEITLEATGYAVLLSNKNYEQ